jgi:hypothetical protein
MLERTCAMKKPELWHSHHWLLHHHVPAHMSMKTTNFVTNNNMVIIPHSPCLPDLVPCYFTLFPQLKMKLKGQHFEAVSDARRESQAVLDSIKENDFHGAFEVWKKQWDHCICSQGDCFVF